MGLDTVGRDDKIKAGKLEKLRMTKAGLENVSKITSFDQNQDRKPCFGCSQNLYRKFSGDFGKFLEVSRFTKLCWIFGDFYHNGKKTETSLKSH